MAKLSKKNVLRQLGGSAKEISKDIAAFAKTARILSSDHPRLIDTHPQKWVGVYRGRVAAQADTLNKLMVRLSRANVPADKTIIRFIDKKERTFIL